MIFIYILVIGILIVLWSIVQSIRSRHREEASDIESLGLISKSSVVSPARNTEEIQQATEGQPLVSTVCFITLFSSHELACDMVFPPNLCNNDQQGLLFVSEMPLSNQYYIGKMVVLKVFNP